MIQVRKMQREELTDLTGIYAACFKNESQHRLWVEANLAAYPRMVYYVAIYQDKIVGYAHWSVKSGFRTHAVVELEQLAVLANYGKKGIGKMLLEQSFSQFKTHLSLLGVAVKAVLMTTREGNFAERLYEKVFSVKRQAIIKNYGSGDEVILFRRYTLDSDK